MNDRPDYIKCIEHSHVDLEDTSWCGRELYHEWAFVDAAHAAEHGRKAGRLVACPDCVDAITEALQNGHE